MAKKIETKKVGLKPQKVAIWNVHLINFSNMYLFLLYDYFLIFASLENEFLEKISMHPWRVYVNNANCATFNKFQSSNLCRIIRQCHQQSMFWPTFGRFQCCCECISRIFELVLQCSLKWYINQEKVVKWLFVGTICKDLKIENV